MDEHSIFIEYLRSLEMGYIAFYNKTNPILPIKSSGFARVAPIQNMDNPSSFRMEICPGDTIKQCKALYSKDRIKELIRNEEEGWRITTNLHLSSSYRNVIWLKSQHVWQDYLTFWYKENTLGNIRQYTRTEWKNLITKLEKSGNLSGEAFEDFELKVVQKNYSRMNLCASLRVWFDIKWSDLAESPHEVAAYTRKMLENIEKTLE